VLTSIRFIKTHFIFRHATARFHFASWCSRAGRAEVSLSLGHFVAVTTMWRNGIVANASSFAGPGYHLGGMNMLRRTMIALCTVASIAMLAPGLALARGGGGGGGHGGGGGGHAGGFGGGGFGGARAGGFGGGGFAARGFSGGNFGNSFARAAPVGAAAGVAAVQGGRFANGSFNRGSFNHGAFNRGRFDHGFRHGRRFFFAGGFWGPGYDDYWDYPDYAYDDSYYDNGGCYIVQRRVHTSYGWRVRPVQVCG
jgi:hypothetical protein